MTLEAVDWVSYYDTVQGRPPRPTLVKALEFFERKTEQPTKFAIDLDSGAGNDALALLERGWKVLAIDGEPDSAKRLLEKTKGQNKKHLSVMTSKFEDVTLPACDLLNSSYSLSFCHPDYFERLWDKITSSIRIGGRFAGQIFGNNDEWSQTKTMTFFTKTQVEKLFGGFEFEYFEEEDKDGTIASGDTKHWHLFHIVAKKF